MKIVKIPKKAKGEYRTIYCPSPAEKTKLKALLVELENTFKAFEKNGNIDSNIIHGFVSGKSPVTNATCHIGKNFTFSMDLEDFFDSVKVNQVSSKIPASMLSEVFVDGSPRQGLPTSPMVCNIAAISMDLAILRFLKKKAAPVVYTRYADDLSFSFNDFKTYEVLKNGIPNIIRKCGFKVKGSKTRLQDARYGLREVTGVMVGNDGIQVSRAFKRKMRAAKHQNNEESLRGMEEWAKLKVPSPKREVTSIDLNLKLIYSIAKRKKIKLIDPVVYPLEEVRHGDFIFTNDLRYILGMSELSAGWTSCYKFKGVNCNAPLLISQFKSFIAAIVSRDVKEIYGEKRQKLKARCIVYELETGELFATQFYGDPSGRERIVEKLHEIFPERKIIMGKADAKKIIGKVILRPTVIKIGSKSVHRIFHRSEVYGTRKHKKDLGDGLIELTMST